MEKKLVACFSPTGNTWKIAGTIAKLTGADLLRLEAEVPYSAADLDWRDAKSRSSVEMKDLRSRPTLKALPDNMEEYSTIYLGFPIWWYVAPTLVNTFLESQNLEGKTIIPFATSGSSGMGRTVDRLRDSAPGARIREGRRFPAGAGTGEIQAWLDTLS